MVRNRVLTFGLLVFCLTAVAPVVGAQQSSYPPVPHECPHVSGDVQIVDGRTEVLFRGHLTVFGGPGSASPGERIVVTIASGPVFFGQTTAASDGSYSISGTLPPEIGPGEHRIFVDFSNGGSECVDPILVVTSFVVPAPAGVVPNVAPGAAAGTLPKTGGNIAANVLWALLLISVGVSLVVFARRHGMLQLAGIRQRVSPGTRVLRRRPAHKTELSEVDTAGFTPVVRRAEQEAATDLDDWPFFTPPDS